MKPQFTVKRIVLCCIAFAAGLMTLLALCLPLFQVNNDVIDLLIGYFPTKIDTVESGFSLLDFECNSPGVFKESVVAVGTVSWIQLVIAIETMTVSVVFLFIPNEKITYNTLLGHIIMCVMFIAAYMILGLVYANSYYEYFCIFENGTVKFTDEKASLGNTYLGNPLYTVRTNTLAYIGFTIGILLFITYLVCFIVLKNEPKKTVTMQKSDNLVLTNDVANALKQYKELLDASIITQEEFEKKKQEILNS